MQLILLERSEEKRNEYEQKKVRKMCRANQCLQGQNEHKHKKLHLGESVSRICIKAY